MAGNMFLEITGPDIKGSSTDSKHKDQLQILSWGHSFSQPTSPTRSAAGGGTVEQAAHAPFSFTKYTDSATDDLLKYIWNGKQIKKCVFSAYRADGGNSVGVLYLKIEMEQVIISHFSVGGGAGDIPVENVSLNYGKISYTYMQQKKEDGTAGGAKEVVHDLIKQEVA